MVYAYLTSPKPPLLPLKLNWRPAVCCERGELIGAWQSIVCAFWLIVCLSIALFVLVALAALSLLTLKHQLISYLLVQLLVYA
jgi:hypothetical protein